MGTVRTVRSAYRRLPAAIEKSVFDTAMELGRPVVDDDLFLLALTRLGQPSPARQVLEGEGVTQAVLLATIRAGGDGGRPPRGGFTYAPAYDAMHARAEAFADTLGDGTITAEHVLLALLWNGHGRSSQVLWRLGVSRERLVEGLAARDVRVPAASLPPQREVDMGDKV